MSQTPAQRQWTPADEKQLRQLRAKGVPLEEIAKMFHRGYSAVARKCRAMGLTNPTLRHVVRSPKAALSDRRATVTRAGKTTLPPLPSLRDK
jgi:DNA-binding transcriptional MerR regulator